MRVCLLYSILSEFTANDELIAMSAAHEMADALRYATGRPVTTCAVKDKTIAELVKGFDPRNTVVINWCEGLYTDERDFWSVPAELDRLGYAYTGSGPATLRLTQDKAKTKAGLQAAGIPTPASLTCTSPAQARRWDAWPAIVKPAKEHGSLGITQQSVVDNRQQLLDRVQWTLDQFGGPVVIEEFIDGDEFNVSLVDEAGALLALPLATIAFKDADYHARLVTFDSKWKIGTAADVDQRVICPAPVTDILRLEIEGVAMQAFDTLHLRDYGRIDLRVRDGVPYVLDVNANPDITSEGGFVRAHRAAGYSYGETMWRIVEIAAARGGLGQ